MTKYLPISTVEDASFCKHIKLENTTTKTVRATMVDFGFADAGKIKSDVGSCSTARAQTGRRIVCLSRIA
ncbi:hypothetical protein H257_11376 [Aphanomyces astaci]|uniref:Uncharacterized protein n=1 Tax=Aphanomyces astaci TaxID=112090 RepID=W4G319_APHAT|nr:hypothetical protein H257_11376 [Aphanomyces astaci]ETV74065.1 hypothetical protein H257_11376 [Aphanomyces astaci]|eukprot:XP_009836578.1 hypothetical protein H257_11376 [Aphanomyces astaci]